MLKREAKPIPRNDAVRICEECALLKKLPRDAAKKERED